MATASNNEASGPGGIQVACGNPVEAANARDRLAALFDGQRFGRHLVYSQRPGPGGDVLLCCGLPERLQVDWAPGHDTLGLARRLGLATSAPADGPALEREILAALVLGPMPQAFPSLAELSSAVRVRANVVRAARLTTLAFDTCAVERPPDCWLYDEDRGFLIRPEVSLIDALRKATQPGVSGTLYAFSCYRATEYVLLLGLAEELAVCNPVLYAALQRLWQHRAIVSGEFHEVFLHETGSVDHPLPPRWYVPGDRVWFRNPDEASADASGYEGSWVIYLGNGLFSNFWKRGQPFDFDGKCLEVFHWRDAVFLDAEGEPRIDELRVAQHVAETRRNPAEMARILARMQRYRDPRGIYAEGGCIDSTREQARWVCPGTGDLVLPIN